MVIYDSRRVALTLGKLLARGGEGSVYLVEGRPGQLAKIYTPAKPDYEPKLHRMRQHPPLTHSTSNHHPIAWPTDLLYDRQGAFLGYLMPLVQRAVPLFDVFNPRRRTQTLPGFDARYLHRTARNLAAAVAALHNRGYVIGDLNESNVLVTPTALVTIIDTDSFQVIEHRQAQIVIYPCPVGKPEYTPPELQGKTFMREMRQAEHDRFGLAVLIFQLLMEGSHPYRSRWLAAGDPPPVAEKIAKGWFPYAKLPAGPVAPPSFAPALERLHPALADLFRRGFEGGHLDARLRPAADEWTDALAEAEKSLVTCRNGHVYSGHLKGCPVCGGAGKTPSITTIPRRTTAGTTASPRQPAVNPTTTVAASRPVTTASRPAPAPMPPAAGTATATQARTTQTSSPPPQPRRPQRAAPTPTPSAWSIPTRGPTRQRPAAPFSSLRMRIRWEWIWAFLKTWLMVKLGWRPRPPRPAPPPIMGPSRWAVIRRTAAVVTVAVATASAALYAGPEVQAWVVERTALVAPIVAPITAPVGAPLPPYVVQVDARQGWYETQLLAAAGSRIDFELVSGQWTTQASTGTYSGPEGSGWICGQHMTATQCAEPLPNAARGSLVARLGNEVFTVPKAGYIIAQQTGTLAFRINDADAGLTDNDGQLQVRVKISSPTSR